MFSPFFCQVPSTTEIYTLSLHDALPILSHDARFDGVFFVAINSTGIYCRTVCPARRPLRKSCTFYGSAAAAERAGYRPCLRSEEHTSELQSQSNLVCRLLLEKKKTNQTE